MCLSVLQTLRIQNYTTQTRFMFLQGSSFNEIENQWADGQVEHTQDVLHMSSFCQELINSDKNGTCGERDQQRRNITKAPVGKDKLLPLARSMKKSSMARVQWGIWLNSQKAFSVRCQAVILSRAMKFPGSKIERIKKRESEKQARQFQSCTTQQEPHYHDDCTHLEWGRKITKSHHCHCTVIVCWWLSRCT